MLPVEDMSKTYIEHSMVIDNFVIKVGGQIKDRLCRVFSDGVQYQWKENDDKVIIPDASIICNLRDRKNINEKDECYHYLYKTVTEKNKDELQIVMFPNLHITFDELFNLGAEV